MRSFSPGVATLVSESLLYTFETTNTSREGNVQMNEYLPWAWLGHISHLDFDGNFSGRVIDTSLVLLWERCSGHFE